MGNALQYTAIQILVLIANASVGFVVVQRLEKVDYAWFTAAFIGQTMISVLSDSGLSSALTSIGGALVQQPSRFAGIVYLIKKWRLRFLICSMTCVLPFVAWMMNSADASFSTNLLLLLLVCAAGHFAIESSFFASVLKLQGDVKSVVRSEAIFSFLRLLLVAISVAISTNVWGVLFASLLATFTQYAFLRGSVQRSLSMAYELDPNWNGAIKKNVLHVIPVSIWHCIQGNITALLIGLTTNAQQLADIGAIGRFGILFNVVMLPLGHFLLPKLATSSKSGEMMRHLLRTLLLVLVGIWSIVAIGSLARVPLLSLLGSSYEHLSSELVCYLIATALAFSGHLFWSVALTKGWVQFGWADIPVTICAQVVFLLFFPINSMVNAIAFGAIASLVHLVSGIALVSWGAFNANERGGCAVELEIP